MIFFFLFFFLSVNSDILKIRNRSGMPYLFSAKRSAVIRASDDFWPRDPASHTIHIASVAYNTIFLGEFMQPDWDMFHVRKHN